MVEWLNGSEYLGKQSYSQCDNAHSARHCPLSPSLRGTACPDPSGKQSYPHREKAHSARHCEVRSNPRLRRKLNDYYHKLTDCFVSRNDVPMMMVRNHKTLSLTYWESNSLNSSDSYRDQFV